ncbi:MAG: dienelactone hydrolase family protein, partial [Acidimicrobiales bacterium]
GDVDGAATYLRSLQNSNGKVGTIGYCSGGRQSFLAAVSLPIQAAVVCYGAFIIGTPPEGFPLKVTSLEPMIGQLSCPVLGLFGADDTFPPPADVEYLGNAIEKAGKVKEFHIYEGAGHAFFATDRPSYRPEAANDGWAKIAAFYGTHLS